jgi:nitroimidazol reductase NimA-like FMN-containing flavoprotein (pyridoxamine 5'-phosphate oxidase superfamily)
MVSRSIEMLSDEDCYALGATMRVGRFVFVDGDGPIALPVNFALVGPDVIFRIETGSGLRRGVGTQASFEIDRIESAEHLGWSVLLRGQAEEVALDEVPDLLQRAGAQFPQPWAAGTHNLWVRLRVRSVTGCRLSAQYFSLVF